MSATSDAYILVTIPNATLNSSSTGTLIGQLALEYVTYDIPPTAQVTQDVLLVLVLRSGNDNNTVLFEAPLDPARALTMSSVRPASSSSGGERQRYVFHTTHDDTEFTIELPKNNNNNAEDNIELFHSVLVGYIADVHINDQRLQSAGAGAALPPTARVTEEAIPAEGAGADEDLRGRFVLMNEDDGEIVGTLDRSVRVYEDPSLIESGHERDPLIVEVPEGDGLLEEEVLVRTVPPEDRDWVLKTAVFVSHAISSTTTLLTSAMTSASYLYISSSTPSTPPAAPGSRAASPRPTTPSSSSKGGQQAQSRAGQPPPPPPPPSRTLLLLQSPTTRKNLTRVHAVSGSASKLSGKAVAAAESLISRAIGSGSSSTSTRTSTSTSTSTNKGKSRASFFAAASDALKSPTPTPTPTPRSRGPSPAPPDGSKPLLPARQAKTPPLRTSTSIALSAALILASIEASTIRLVEAGGAAVTAAVRHKYGTVAGENAAIAGRAARNIVLVYVDVRGLGRRVIVRRVAKTWVKGRIASSREEAAARRGR